MSKRTVVILKGDQTGQELLVEALRVLQPGVIGIDDLRFEEFDLSARKSPQDQKWCC